MRFDVYFHFGNLFPADPRFGQIMTSLETLTTKATDMSATLDTDLATLQGDVSNLTNTVSHATSTLTGLAQQLAQAIENAKSLGMSEQQTQQFTDLHAQLTGQTNALEAAVQSVSPTPTPEPPVVTPDQPPAPDQV